MPALPLQPDIRECADLGTLYFNPIDCSRAVLDRAGERVREEIREEISQAASSAASNALTELAQAVNEGVHQLLKIMVAWITDVEAVDLTSGSAATTIDQMGYLLSPVVLLVGVVGLLVAAGNGADPQGQSSSARRGRARRHSCRPSVWEWPTFC